MTYHKLVRDRIPDRIHAAGQTPITRILEPREYRSELEKKLAEECAEFIEDPTAEEASDILTVLQTIAQLEGISLQMIIEAAQKKRATHGGFEERIYLESVDTKSTTND